MRYSGDFLGRQMPAMATCDAIQTVGLTKRFGRTLALDQLYLTVEKGEVFGFLEQTVRGSRRRSA